MNILGVSALYHDSAACLVQDGQIVAAAQEERFTRKKHDPCIPSHATRYCLSAGKVGKGELDLIVFYDKPLTKFIRLLNTYGQITPAEIKPFVISVPLWLKAKAWVVYSIERQLRDAGMFKLGDFQFTEHHHSHAASVFYLPPFDSAAIITVDGVGEWTTTAIGVGEKNKVKLLVEQRFPHSLGLLYSAFTYFTGFRVNSGEYKLMGLAPYRKPHFVETIKEHLIGIREDGSFWLNMRYFGHLNELRMTNKRFEKLFGGPPRHPESEITEREMDLARSIQVVTEEVLLKMARYARAITGKRHLCLAGGVDSTVSPTERCYEAEFSMISGYNRLRVMGGGHWALPSIIVIISRVTTEIQITSVIPCWVLNSQKNRYDSF